MLFVGLYDLWFNIPILTANICYAVTCIISQAFSSAVPCGVTQTKATTRSHIQLQFTTWQYKLYTSKHKNEKKKKKKICITDMCI